MTYCYNNLFPHSNDSEAIAEGKDDTGDTGVLLHIIIKATDALRLLVTVVVGVGDVTIPKGVVGEDKGAWSHKGEEGFVGLDIGALVAIKECHIKLHTEFPGLLPGITDDEAYVLCPGGFLYPLAGSCSSLISKEKTLPTPPVPVPVNVNVESPSAMQRAE